MIEKHFTPTVSLFFRASRQIFHKRAVAWLFYAGFVGVPTVFLLLILYRGRSLSFEVIAGIPVWGVIASSYVYALLLVPLLQYLHVRRTVLSSPSANQVQHYSISENGIRNYGEGVDISLGWDKIIRLQKSKHFLLFFVAKNMAYFIPLELLTDAEIAQIEAWAGAHRS